MKKLILLFIVVCSFTTAAFAQKYRTAADTVRLNEEYAKVSYEISILSGKLTTAQNDLQAMKAKASNAESNAQSAADHSSMRADQAGNEGSVKDARKAKRSAKTAYKKAKTSRSADGDVTSQEKKIAKLSKDLSKQQDRLQAITEMRTAIYSKLGTQPMN